MQFLLDINWREVFSFTKSPIEIVIRGVVVYLVLVILLRVVLKREGGALSFTDVLTVVLLGDASQNAMADSHKSIADGMLLVLTILLCNLALDTLQFRFTGIARLLSPPALVLVRDGKLLRRNMRREFVREEDILAQAHAAGVERIEDIHHAFMEGDGQITIIPRDKPAPNPPHKDKRPF